MLHLLSFLPIRRDALPAPVSTSPADALLQSSPGACAHDNGLGVLPQADWPFHDMVGQDDPPLWVWFLILGTIFAAVFTILGYQHCILVQYLRAA